MYAYLLARLAEPSTWRGILALVTAAGVALTPEQSSAIIAAGLAVIGLIGVFTADKNSAAPSPTPAPSPSRSSPGMKLPFLFAIALALLAGSAHPAHAQMLGWRQQVMQHHNDHESRLHALELLLLQQKLQQTAPVPAPAPPAAQQPLVITTPAPAPPQIIVLGAQGESQAPAQQTLPIPGTPQQTLPVPGSPQQTLPIPGTPQQNLPVPGTPQQTLPSLGTPQQVLPASPLPNQNVPTPNVPPGQPVPVPPAPSTPSTPAAPGTPQQTLPTAPKTTSIAYYSVLPRGRPPRSAPATITIYQPGGQRGAPANVAIYRLR